MEIAYEILDIILMFLTFVTLIFIFGVLFVFAVDLMKAFIACRRERKVDRMWKND